MKVQDFVNLTKANISVLDRLMEIMSDNTKEFFIGKEVMLTEEYSDEFEGEFAGEVGIIQDVSIYDDEFYFDVKFPSDMYDDCYFEYLIFLSDMKND